MARRPFSGWMFGIGTAAATALLLLSHPGGLTAALRTAASGPVAPTEDATSDEMGRYEMDLAITAVHERMQLREVLAGELIAGRVTLPSVAARFAQLNEANPGMLPALEAKYPGATDEALAAASVLESVEDQDLSADERDTVLPCLEEEFRQRYGCEYVPIQ